MVGGIRRGVVMACAVAVGTASISGAASPASANEQIRARHVLLISVDGLHQTDLEWYVQHHPDSALAGLLGHGVEYTDAHAPVPSDSYPGIVAQLTGGNPATTGIWYDDSYNHAVLPAGSTRCAGAMPGAEVTYFEAADRNQQRLDAGQGLPGLPGSILQMTPNPDTVIDPKKLPVDPASCQPIYPHNYIRVNTAFEVAREAGLRTAWSDKHPTYEVLNGPSGMGVQDLFTPEINSEAPVAGSGRDWTKVNRLTQQYDSYKVQAVVNEIDGYDHSREHLLGTPAIFGMNFQTVSTAQKLPVSDGLPGGYLADGTTPGRLLSEAFDYINAQVGRFVDELRARDLDRSTVIILSAKHGQSPQTPSALTRIDDGVIVDHLNAAWKSAHPAAVQPLVAFSVNDDGMLLWLNDRSSSATSFARTALLSFNGVGNDINGNPKPYTDSGLRSVFAGDDAAHYFGAAVGDPRVPDVFGIAQYGVVYTGHKAKIAEHGGANPQDLNVPLVLSGVAFAHGSELDTKVETTTIAPTILALLGLDPNRLMAVQIEHTATLQIHN